MFQKGHKSFWSEETKRKMSKMFSGKNNPSYGRKVSKETRKKLSESLKKYFSKSGYHPLGMLGKHQTEKWKKEKSEAMSGDKSPFWKGDNIGYGAVHDYIRSRLGKPTKCEHCGSVSAKRFEWANKNGKYKRELSDWVSLCKSCHIKYDKGIIEIDFSNKSNDIVISC